MPVIEIKMNQISLVAGNLMQTVKEEYIVILVQLKYLSYFYFILSYLMCMSVFACMNVWVQHACLMPVEVRRMHWIPWNLVYRWL